MARRRSSAQEHDLRAAYSAHGGELYGFACRSLGDPHRAEEVVQETFLRAWRAADRYDPELGSPRTWLFAILRNTIIDARRAEPPPSLQLDGHDPVEESGIDQVLLSWQMEEALRRISDDHRRVLMETYYRSRPYAEVAEDLGIPEGTVKSRAYYALRALRLALEEMGWTDD